MSKDIYMKTFEFGKPEQENKLEYSELSACFWLSNKDGEKFTLLAEEMIELLKILKEGGFTA